MTTEIKTTDSETMDRKAFAWARGNQGFAGTYEDWCSLPTAERAEYEAGAAGIQTA